MKTELLELFVTVLVVTQGFSLWLIYVEARERINLLKLFQAYTEVNANRMREISDRFNVQGPAK